MATPDKTKIIDKMRLGDLTVGEFKAVIRKETQQVLFEFLWELQQYLPDPDEGLEFKPEIAQRLRQFIAEKEQAAEDVNRESGLDE